MVLHHVTTEGGGRAQVWTSFDRFSIVCVRHHPLQLLKPCVAPNMQPVVLTSDQDDADDERDASISPESAFSYSMDID